MMMPQVRGSPHCLSGCYGCHSDAWAVLAANTAAECAQTAAEAAVVAANAANAAAQAASAVTVSHLDTGLGGNYMGRCRGAYDRNCATLPTFPTRKTPFRPDASCRRVQRDETWHGWAQERHGSRSQDGYIGTVRSRSYKWPSGGSASKTNQQRFQQKFGGHHHNHHHHHHGQGMAGFRAKDGQPRRGARWWHKPQQQKGNHSKQKQVRLQAAKPGVSRATQTVTDQGTQTVHYSKDAAFSAAEEIMKGYLEPEPELPEIFMLAGNDSEDDEAAFFPGFLPCGPKSRWPKLLDRATTISSASSAGNISQEDSDEDFMMAAEQLEHDTNHDVIPGILAVEN